MQFRYKIHPELQADWLPVIERHFDLTLAPLRASLRSAQVAFTRIGENGETSYRCELKGRPVAGEAWSFAVEHRDGRIAISDAFSRARRVISRARRVQQTPPLPRTAGSARPR